MKNRFIKNEIKKESENNVPDVLDRVVFAAQSQGLLQEQSKQTVQNTVSATKRRRISFTAFFSAAAAIVICLAIVLPITLRGGNLPSNINLSANDVYGIGAVSTAKLLGSNVSSKAVARLARSTKNMSTQTESDSIKDNIERFNEYFVALDSFMGEELVSTTTVTNTNVKYPYETMMTIKGKDVDGSDAQYIMYYTETLVKTEVDEDEQEKGFSLVGIMVIDNVDYYLEGERTEESEKDEQENELKIRAYLNKDVKDTYIQMEQETSIENNEREIEYVYSVYSNDNLVEQTSVEFETERKGAKEEVEYELEFIKGSAKGKYKLEKETVAGITQIKVKYNLDGKQGEFKIREKEVDGLKHYEYVFQDGESIEF